MFDAAHLELIRRAIGDDAAYGVLIDALPRLEAILASARERGCTLVRCTLREPDFVIILRFAGNNGQRLTTSVSFRRKYERTGKRSSRETALAVRLCIESLVCATGFALMR